MGSGDFGFKEFDEERITRIERASGAAIRARFPPP
jgi:hypothetical protein